MIKELEWANFEYDKYKIKDRESLKLIEPELQDLKGFIGIGYSDLIVYFEKETNTANLPVWTHQHLKYIDNDNTECPIRMNLAFGMTVFRCPYWLYRKAIENRLKNKNYVPPEISSAIIKCEKVCNIDFVM